MKSIFVPFQMAATSEVKFCFESHLRVFFCFFWGGRGGGEKGLAEKKKKKKKGKKEEKQNLSPPL